MKIRIFTLLLTLAALGGCTSTDENNQENTAATNTQNTSTGGNNLTDKELDELASKTNFTPAQLKAAAKSIGYKCSLTVTTGSRLKKKVCSTKQQRDVRAEAAKRLMRTMSKSSMSDG
mgnify:CR=1 FL=1